MSIQLTCAFCKTHLEADDEMAGKAISCPNCSKVCIVPDPNRPLEPVDKPHLIAPHQQQAVENLSESMKHCPKCNAEAEHGALLCVHCGHNFVTGTSVAPGKRRKRERVHRGFIGTIVYFAIWLMLVAFVGGLGYAGLVWILDVRASKEIAIALESGNLDLAEQKYHQIYSWHHWLEYVGWSNPYRLRLAQFDIRRGKSYKEAKDSQLPFVVLVSVWGGSAQIKPKAWIRFRLISYYDEPVEVNARCFLLIGQSNNLAWVESNLSSKGRLHLQKGDGIESALCFDGIVKTPVFLEYNNGRLLSRTPIYINYSMDSLAHDEQGHPGQGKVAEQFPINKPWREQKLPSDVVTKTWQDYVDLREPPAQPAWASSFLEGVPPKSDPAVKTP